MIGETILAIAAAASATLGSADPTESPNASSPPPTEECYQASSGEQCDIILRHAGPPERLTQTTDYECRDGFRFRLFYEFVERGHTRVAYSISATTLVPPHIATVSPSDLDRIRSRFDGATASIRLVACGVYEGTAELLVTYFRVDWPQMRAVRFVVNADGAVDAGEEEPFTNN